MATEEEEREEILKNYLAVKHQMEVINSLLLLLEVTEPWLKYHKEEENDRTK